jgi:hypothetical protein
MEAPAHEHRTDNCGEIRGIGSHNCRYVGTLRSAPRAKRKGADVNIGTDHPANNMRKLAVQIADRFARTEIEMFCRNVAAGTGRPIFDVSCPMVDVGAREGEWLAAVADAVHYIELRSDALPYRMHHVRDLVWFEELA